MYLKRSLKQLNICATTGKRVLEATGNLAMTIALRNIENEFVNNLAKNYELWAADGNYRATRANGVCVVDNISTEPTIVTLVDSSMSTISSAVVSTSQSQSSNSNGQSTDTTTSASSSSSSIVYTSYSKGKGNRSNNSSTSTSVSINTATSSSTASSSTSSSSFSDSFSVLSFSSAFNSFLGGIGNSMSSSSKSLDTLSNNDNNEDDDDIDIDDANFESPAVLTDDICLIPGEPVVRIEEAPNNARRIFTGLCLVCVFRVYYYYYT